MRENQTADWAFSIRSTFENLVRQNYPNLIRNWPLLRVFDFNAYEIDNTYLVLLLKEKLGGTPAGPGVAAEFPFPQHPSLPLNITNVSEWMSFLRSVFCLRSDDAAFIIPIHDSGKDARGDFELFNEDERLCWQFQVQANLESHLKLVGSNPALTQASNSNITIQGDNARINIHSTDHSSNISSSGSASIFNEMRGALTGGIASPEELSRIVGHLDGIEKAASRSEGLSSYQSFISSLADHITIVSPFLPALTAFIGRLS